MRFLSSCLEEQLEYLLEKGVNVPFSEWWHFFETHRFRELPTRLRPHEYFSHVTMHMRIKIWVQDLECTWRMRIPIKGRTFLALVLAPAPQSSQLQRSLTIADDAFQRKVWVLYPCRGEGVTRIQSP